MATLSEIIALIEKVTKGLERRSTALNVKGSKHIVFAGIDFKGFDNGVNVEKSSDIRVYDCGFEGNKNPITNSDMESIVKILSELSNTLVSNQNNKSFISNLLNQLNSFVPYAPILSTIIDEISKKFL